MAYTSKTRIITTMGLSLYTQCQEVSHLIHLIHLTLRTQTPTALTSLQILSPTPMQPTKMPAVHDFWPISSCQRAVHRYQRSKPLMTPTTKSKCTKTSFRSMWPEMLLSHLGKPFTASRPTRKKKLKSVHYSGMASFTGFGFPP